MNTAKDFCLWDQAQYSKDPVIDVPGIGRYRIKRERRIFRAYLNGQSTSYFDPKVENVKAMVERAIRANA
jgi:hypothetical protein